MNNQSQAYKQKVDAELKVWEAKASLIKAKGNNLAADAKVEFEKHMQDLQQTKTDLAAYADRVSDKAEDKWDEMKDEAEEKWNKFTTAVGHFVSKYN